MRFQRRPPRDELVNVFEYEDVARSVLPPDAFATIAGSDRTAFDRITFRPRMLIPTLDLDLSVELFGHTYFTPIIVGPVAEQGRIHREGELATVRGASAANAAVVIAGRSSMPLAEIAGQAKTPLWYAVYADDVTAKSAAQVAQLRSQVVCVSGPRTRVSVPFSSVVKTAVDLGKTVSLPVVIKGVMTVADAKAAIDHGAQGIVVSNHGVMVPSTSAPIEVLASIVDVVGTKATVLVDGSFRRGSDILKALVLGARGVLLARPVMWGLAAYGADGVQGLIEMLQTDLGRHLAALGASNIASLKREMIRVHKR